MTLIWRLADLLGDTALSEELTRQLGRPRGMLGYLVGRGLARDNAELTRWVLGQLDPGPAHAVLEVGCGPAVAVTDVLRRCGGGGYDGVDPSPVMLEQARRRNRRSVAAGLARFSQAEAARLPFPDGRFDAALAVNVVYFWREPEVELREVRRVLAPGGRLALGLRPRSGVPSEALARFEAAGHRAHEPEDLVPVLGDAGYTDVHTVRAPDGYAAVLGSA